MYLVMKCRSKPEVAEMIAKLQEKYHGKRVIVSRDKLDPIKGVRQKLQAYELFLSLYPEWQGKVCHSCSVTF
jgi:trehalose 6-phosphate synthase/phosphatase